MNISGDKMKILKYEEKYKNEWDQFIENSKNGTFLIKRDYMEYHQDRFLDNSYIIIDDKGKVEALIPGTIGKDIFYTHKGLTYGGFILNKESKIKDIKKYFELLNDELRKIGIKKVIYKTIPYIYYSYPSQEDEYILYTLDSKNIFTGIASVIDLEKNFKFNKSRKSSISKAKRFGFTIDKDNYYIQFWKILENNLEKNHNAKPVHSLQEILYLKSLFKNNIELYSVKNKNLEVVAGTVLYINNDVVHVQYISANEEGKENSALDFLFDYLIKNKFKDKKYFDFGTSVEGNGKYLNEGLVFQKEGFGARGVVYKQFEYLLGENI